MFDRIKASLIGAFKSWTIWANGVAGAALAGLPMLQETLPQLQAYVDNNLFKYLMGAVIVVNILLRFKTNKPLGDK